MDSIKVLLVLALCIVTVRSQTEVDPSSICDLGNYASEVCSKSPVSTCVSCVVQEVVANCPYNPKDGPPNCEEDLQPCALALKFENCV